MIYAGILAGGIGSRMKTAGSPKQFLSIAGKPIILHTIERFAQCSRFDRIYVAAVKGFVEHLTEMVKNEISDSSRITIVEGGADRNGSMANVISAIRAVDSDPDSILVTHDGVRPFVPLSVIEDNIDEAIRYGAADTAVPSIDTIIRSDDGRRIDEIPARDVLYNSQTPQSFRISWFEQDYNALDDEQKERLTDACKIFLLSGREVRIVQGDPCNIKITTPIDLRLAEAIAAEQSEN